MSILPSPLYILAVKDIADSHTSTPSDVLAILICAIAVMLLKRNGWTLAAVLSLVAGIYGIVNGVNKLS